MELATLMRLRGAIRGSLNGVPTEQAAVAGKAMMESYLKCRAEALTAIDSNLRAEFGRMFPTMIVSSGIGAEAAARFNEARASLGRMDGWLQGQIEYLKYEHQVQAEAEAKVKADRGIGFKQ